MWHWDQGHLPFFQFDALRQIAAYVVRHDFAAAQQRELLTATGIKFPVPPGYTPWRQYARVLRCCLLVSKIGGKAVPTPVASLLAQPGLVTSDEYFHFLVRSFTDPSPSAHGWKRDATFRFPLLFSLKYVLTKATIRREFESGLDEIVGAYRVSGFDGTESDLQFIDLVNAEVDYESEKAPRQARESLSVMAQISYLYTRANKMFVSLNSGDADELFHHLTPIEGERAIDRDAEVQRLGTLFIDGYNDMSFDYPSTVVDEVVESGFHEGNKVRRTHLTIERNSSLRREFFLINPTVSCDVCGMNTQKTYPWTDRIIDLHHLLPLSSGTRVESVGNKLRTTLEDLVPVCPSCHRAVHRFYDSYLRKADKIDFVSGQEARDTYNQMKSDFPGVRYA